MADTRNEVIGYDPSGAFVPKTGISRDELAGLAPQLEAARREVLRDAELFANGSAVPKEKDPLDAGFIELPVRLLEHYHEKPAESELGRILRRAHRLRDQVDRVVVLGIGGSYMGARA